ncbi:hypothetical protein [Burkholderia sp. Bp9142]|uniref:hypothetical protein n=1 Tax=Burkholderia sp. Bp9142 TaxID=2184573 RepID=UPI001C895C41|nr:hypothetical protein [Burkholderia sp. Bp9142]
MAEKGFLCPRQSTGIVDALKALFGEQQTVEAVATVAATTWFPVSWWRWRSERHGPARPRGHP